MRILIGADRAVALVGLHPMTVAGGLRRSRSRERLPIRRAWPWQTGRPTTRATDKQPCHPPARGFRKSVGGLAFHCKFAAMMEKKRHSLPQGSKLPLPGRDFHLTLVVAHARRADLRRCCPDGASRTTWTERQNRAIEIGDVPYEERCH